MTQLIDTKHPEYALIQSLLPTLARITARRTAKRTGLKVSLSAIEAGLTAALNGCGPFTFITAGPCLVGYNVSKPWWSDTEQVLSEEFIVRYKSGSFGDTVRALESLAADLSCQYLVFSSLAMTRQDAYEECLKRKGFIQASREFVKPLACNGR